jgi:hypothetical protein
MQDNFGMEGVPFRYVYLSSSILYEMSTLYVFRVIIVLLRMPRCEIMDRRLVERAQIGRMTEVEAKSYKQESH